jgi:hypothetical protein
MKLTIVFAKKRTAKILAFALGPLICAGAAPAQTAESLMNKLVQKGLLTDKEAKELMADSTTNAVSASKWKLNNAIKNIELYGDVRLRYEYRGTENVPGSGVSGDAYQKERFRYALRVGLRGELFDDWYYGLRLDTSSNPRSTWNTFGGDTVSSTTSSPSGKTDDGINVGLAYLGWKPTGWMDVTLGRMPNPIYTTPMIWDPDLTPEGAAEKFKVSVSDNVDLFATFGQFVYQDTVLDTVTPSSDTFLLAWQVGANVKLAKDVSLKVAPVLYNYTGQGQVGSALYTPYTGEGRAGTNVSSGVSTGAFNQSGISNLLVMEIPAELNFKVGSYGARIFGDFSYNIYGNDRARAAYAARLTGPADGALSHAYTDQNKAYQIGAAFGNLGLVYGQTSKKNTWEARAYWQHVEQYAADANLLDSDFFEGRANLQGVFTAFAYSITDGIIGTVRYGYATRINDQLGTGGNNLDLPLINPIRNYHLIQCDLTWRF